MKILKLYHKDEVIGTISNVAVEDMFEMSGDIVLTDAALRFKAMFTYLSDEEALTNGAEPPFEEDLLNDWFLQDESGQKKVISCPGIDYDSAEIFWRDE